MGTLARWGRGLRLPESAAISIWWQLLFDSFYQAAMFWVRYRAVSGVFLALREMGRFGSDDFWSAWAGLSGLAFNFTLGLALDFTLGFGLSFASGSAWGLGLDLAACLGSDSGLGFGLLPVRERTRACQLRSVWSA